MMLKPHFVTARSIATGNLKDFSRFYLFKKNPEAQSFVSFLIKAVNRFHLNLEEDAAKLLQFLSPAIGLMHNNLKEDNKFRSKKFTDSIYPKLHMEYLSTHFPDVVFITGNNDLSQIEAFAKTLFNLKMHLILRECETYLLAEQVNKISPEIMEKISKEVEERISNIPIVITGKGGHGVTPGPIFASSEAQAMGHYLQSLLQYKHTRKNPIILESDSLNSGQNIDFTKKHIKAIEEKAEKAFLAKCPDQEFPGITMLLVPTPVGGIRQLALIAQQAEVETKSGGVGYRLGHVYMLPPKLDVLVQKYYDSNCVEESCINMFSALRETTNYLYYMLETDFMSPLAPHEMHLKSALHTVMNYYGALTGMNTAVLDKFVLIEDVIAFSKIKEKAGGLNYISKYDLALRDRIKTVFDPLITYFNTVFRQIERQYMPRLSDEIEFKYQVNLSKQEQLTMQKKTLFATYNLIVETPDAPVARNDQHKRII